MQAHASTHRPVTHRGIVLETVTVLRRRSTALQAAHWGRDFEQTGMKILDMTRVDWHEAMNIIGNFPSRRTELSAVDAVSFALIRRHDIKRVASFDRHFPIALPEREVISQ